MDLMVYDNLAKVYLGIKECFSVKMLLSSSPPKFSTIKVQCYMIHMHVNHCHYAHRMIT